MIDAQMPESWFEKLMIPPTFPTLLRGAINDGIDQPTGDAADRPPMETLSQISAVIALCVFPAPRMPSPQAVPPTRTVFPTEIAVHPRSIRKSTNQPPLATDAKVEMKHGTPCKRDECNRSMCNVE